MRKGRRSTIRRPRNGLALACGLLLAAGPGVRHAAAAPDAATLLAELGLSQDEITQVRSGTLVRHAVPAASERELTAGLAFRVSSPPAALVAGVKRDLLDAVDPNVTAHGVMGAPGSVADLAKLLLQPDASTRAQGYTSATPGGALNLSSAEIAAFQALGREAAVADVEAQVRSALFARVQAYRTQGLGGVAPYARSGGGSRSAADELRTATGAAKKLEQYVPAAHRLLLSYPNEKPVGTEELFRWSQFDAHGTPTLALTHVLIVPDGDAWVVAQRQYYVSTGYNAEQAVAAFLPSEGGTIVIYTNRTSTDQITGIGGSAKRSLGSKILASQLESLFERAREKIE